ncbi:amidase [Actinomadura decatromicini]|uniref:Amidase n=1 Tax=Actinomadura decatromicini TaxID=2604572 RepID=A0A5D3FQR3_9ACTN|nr:amidase [Actinomadura decatromicini]TYK49445.1 amidase [Actinomadura decatromicini]
MTTSHTARERPAGPAVSGDSEVHYAGLLDVAARIRDRELTPVELTEALLARIEHIDPALCSYATVTADAAIRQARTADAEMQAGRYRGPLHGVPIAVKDNIFTAGIVTAAGTTIHSEHVPSYDSTVVRRLTEAGAILLGKLQLTEGAFAEHHSSVTPPRNPWNPGYWSGASSSGSGVAVAAGLGFGALGTDTGGSIRYPSAANGVTGIKPTWGRVSRHGVFALAASLDHVGPMARSAVDAGAILGAIAGADPRDPTALTIPVPDYLAGLDASVGDLRVGVDRSYNETRVDSETIRMLDEVVAVLRRMGVTIAEVTLDGTAAINALWPRYAGAEAALAHHETFPSRASEYNPVDTPGSIAGLIAPGHTVSGLELMRAHHQRLAFTGGLRHTLRDVDVLLAPVQPTTSLTLAQKDSLYADADALTDFLRFVTPFDMSGNPTITLPGGFDEDDMPLGFQFVGRAFDEELLIRLGDAYQRETDWHLRHPEL